MSVVFVPEIRPCFYGICRFFVYAVILAIGIICINYYKLFYLLFKGVFNLYSVEITYNTIYFICQFFGSALTILFTNKNIPGHQHLSAETLGYIAHLIQTALLLHHCRKCHIEYFLLLIFL